MHENKIFQKKKKITFRPVWKNWQLRPRRKFSTQMHPWISQYCAHKFRAPAAGKKSGKVRNLLVKVRKISNSWKGQEKSGISVSSSGNQRFVLENPKFSQEMRQNMPILSEIENYRVICLLRETIRPHGRPTFYVPHRDNLSESSFKFMYGSGNS